MILTCPECATSYFVDDNRIPRRGRTVKCSSCGARWKALPEGEVAEPEREDAPDLDFVAPEAERAPSEAEEVEFVAPITPVRKPPPAKKANRGLVIGVLSVGFLSMAGAGAIAFRTQVAGVVPGAAAVFAAIGLPVNTIGLAFEGVVSKPILLDGRPVMAVTGAIRNTTDKVIVSPPIRITLVSKGKTPLRDYQVTVTNGRVPPGGVRHFAFNVADPPANARGLEIAFAPEAHGKAVAAAPPAAEAAAHTPAPVEAQPLPPSSPDALPHHE